MTAYQSKEDSCGAAPRPSLVADNVTVGGGQMVKKTFVLYPGGGRLYCFILLCIVCLLFFSVL